MIIRHQRGHGYAVCNDQAKELVQVKTLELAVLVSRYINGDALEDHEKHSAKEAIRKAETAN